MTIKEIQKQLLHYKNDGRSIFVTSSFQTHSIPLLHLASRVVEDIDVLFINTGFHFPETLVFRDQVAELLKLNVIDVHAQVPKNLQKDGHGQFFFVSDPDYCCFLNKVQPMEPYLMQYDVWVNGVRADQSRVRSKMQVEQPAPYDTIRYHPILDWTPKMIYDYRKQFDLPEHPLDKEGYLSIGCVPCTRKLDLSDERSARWYGMNKVECGLHTDLIK